MSTLSASSTALSPLASSELAATLALVVDTIVDLLGFEVVAINLMDDRDDSMFVAAVRGPEEVRQLLLSRRQGRQGWTVLLEESEPWGTLRFLDHRHTSGDPDDMFTWRPDLPVSEHPDAWHPDDALFAPLTASDGRQLGMLSVDVPSDGLRPGATTRRALEAFAVTASLAIEHAQLAAAQSSLVQHFRAVFDSSPIAIAVLDADRRYLRVNDAYCRFLDRDASALLGHDPLDFTHPDDRAVGVRDLRGRASALDPQVVEKRYVRPDGSVVWGRLHLAPLEDSHDAGVVLAQVEDVTERKSAEDELIRQAHYDALTGLPNRVASMRALERALRDAPRDGGHVAAFFCDLDRLKLVNDAHGHAVGDAYLQEMSRRLSAGVRQQDLVGRLSGDEFVVVASGLCTEDAIAMAERLLQAVHQPLVLDGRAFTPSLSIGIAVREGGAQVTADELLAEADAAMYGAKLQDRGSWRLHRGEKPRSAADQLQLRTEVQRALDRGELELHYQPIVRLDDGGTYAYEALLRWNHPTRGLLPPSQFLPVITDSEFESPVTDWVVARACRDAASRPAGHRRVSVNVSSVQVGRAELPGVVAAALAASGLPADQLVLELTEDRLLSQADGAAALRRLRDLGVTLAIDDYGTGYAGLSYLERFDALGVLKLDRSFTASLGDKAVAQHLVRAVVQLAEDCGLALVAEGVETREQAELLARCGVRLAQGYLFGRPLPLAQQGAAPAA